MGFLYLYLYVYDINKGRLKHCLLSYTHIHTIYYPVCLLCNSPGTISVK
jgi:hypothetical protein